MKCKKCRKEVKKGANHKCVPSSGKLFPCKQCSKKFSQASNLYQHIHSIHEVNKAFKCDKCDKTFSHSKNLKRHLMSHEKNDLLCTFCDKLFESQPALISHKKHKHPDQSEMKCDKCNKTFEHELSFKVHREYCHSEKKCKICHKKFTNLKSLRRHVISVHEKALIYKCDKCEMKFSVQNKLHLHKLKEHQNVEFKCQTCGKKFAHTTNLKKHMERCKPEAPSKLPFQCQNCHRSFRYEATLTEHVKACQQTFIVNKEKLMKNVCTCAVCDMSFENVETLHAHIKKTHGPERSQNSNPRPRSERIRSAKENISENITPMSLTDRYMRKDRVLQTVTNVTPMKSAKKSPLKSLLAKNAVTVLHSEPFQNQTDPAINKNFKFHQPIPVRCQRCAEIFKAKHELYIHEEKKHNIKREFSCYACDTKFFLRKSHTDHLKKVHSHKCDICAKNFHEKQDFVNHFESGMCSSPKMLKFNAGLSAFCEICQKKFAGAEALEKHVLAVHLGKGNRKQVTQSRLSPSVCNAQDTFLSYFGLERAK